MHPNSDLINEAMPTSPDSGELLLGVDGGGARTQAVLATADGRILGRGIGPPSDPHCVGVDEACRAIKVAIEGAFCQVSDPRLALEKSHWVLARIGAACFGLAGVDGPQDETVFRDWLQKEGVTFPAAVCNDSELVLAGGTPEGWGVALISATGSVCLGRDSNGATARVGGWGHLLGDEGSGFAMASQALRLATQAADGRGGSPALLQAALAQWSLKDARDLMTFVYRAATTPDVIATLASSVLELAGRRDAAALRIVDEAAEALALNVDIVVQRLGLTKPPLALGGGMIRATLKKAILARVKSPLGPVANVVEPVLGAVAAARRMLEQRSAA